MKSLAEYLAIIMVLLFVGCEKPFSPKGPYEQKLAVFGILSNGSDTQYVRVLKTYDPPGFNPYDVLQDQAVRGAAVTVAQGGSVVQYRETTVPRTNSSRFDDNIVAYIAFPYKVKTGKAHTLDVATPSDGSVHASVTVPDTGYLRLLNPLMLSFNRMANGTAEDLSLQAFISSLTYGFMICMYLDFDVLENSKVVRKRVEVPRLVIKVDTTLYFTYPKLLQRSSTPGLPGSQQIEGAQYTIKAFIARVNELRAQYMFSFAPRRVILVLTQADKNFYTYYNIANGYQDAISIRTDLPDWTNINGGLGIFGAIVTDSVYYNILD